MCDAGPVFNFAPIPMAGPTFSGHHYDALRRVERYGSRLSEDTLLAKSAMSDGIAKLASDPFSSLEAKALLRVKTSGIEYSLPEDNVLAKSAMDRLIGPSPFPRKWNDL